MTELEDLVRQLGTLEATLGDFHTLLSNHMTDYALQFEKLRASVEHSNELNRVRDASLHNELKTLRWALILIASFTVVSLGGFVALALWAMARLF